MKYLAVCPHCEERLPRKWLWEGTSPIRVCPGCKTTIRQSRRWVRYPAIFMIAMMAPAFVVGGIAGALADMMLGTYGLVGAGMGLGVVVWIGVIDLAIPYVSPSEEIIPTCAGCGYNLTGNASGVCPECGMKVSVKQIIT